MGKSKNVGVNNRNAVERKDFIVGDLNLRSPKDPEFEILHPFSTHGNLWFSVLHIVR